MSEIIEVLLYPFTELSGWLVMRDLKRWARTPYVFDTEPFMERQEGMRLTFQHLYGQRKEVTLKTQTKINILIAITLVACLTCTAVPAAILLPDAWAVMTVPITLMGMAAAFFLSVFITRGLLGLNWKDAWAHFRTH